jgi:hypothetical protein
MQRISGEKEIIEFKGQFHEIFISGFFHQTTSPTPNGHVQKRFRIFPNIRGVIRIRN